MAYKLFIEKIKTDTFDKYLKVALENASEPIFISNADADVIFCNKAYLKITGMEDIISISFSDRNLHCGLLQDTI